MSSIFGLWSSYMLEYCWLFALLLRSASYFPGVEGKWTPLPPMLPPSSTHISFSFFIGQSSIPFDCRLFLCLPILGDPFCLFLQIPMLCFAYYLCIVNFCGRFSVVVSVAVSLTSLSGCSSLSFLLLCGLSCTWGLPISGSFVGGFSPPEGVLIFTTPTLFLMWLEGWWWNGVSQWESILCDLKY